MILSLWMSLSPRHIPRRSCISSMPSVSINRQPAFLISAQLMAKPLICTITLNSPLPAPPSMNGPAVVNLHQPTWISGNNALLADCFLPPEHDGRTLAATLGPWLSQRDSHWDWWYSPSEDCLYHRHTDSWASWPLQLSSGTPPTTPQYLPFLTTRSELLCMVNLPLPGFLLPTQAHIVGKPHKDPYQEVFTTL